MQDEILDRKGIYIPMTRVIMTSDETDQAWWDEVAALGWAAMDHNEQHTVERYGRWYAHAYCTHCVATLLTRRVSGIRLS